MTDLHLRDSLIKQVEDTLDSLPIIRDRIEDIITSDNIDYIDSMIDRTYHFQIILENFLKVLANSKEEIDHEDLVMISYDIDLIYYMVDYLDDTALFITKEKKK